MTGPRPDTPPQVVRWVERFAAEMMSDDLLNQLYSDLVAELTGEFPDLAADVGIRRDLDASTRDLLNTFLAEAAKDPNADIVFPPAAIGLARTFAQRGYDVGVLLRLYRIGQRLFWARLMEIIGEQTPDPDLRMAVLQFLWDRMSRVLEQNIDLLVEAHTEESEQRMRGALLRRAETVQAILRGEPVDIDVASGQLGHNLRRFQTALVLWADESADPVDPSGMLESLAGEAAAIVGALRPLTVQSSSRVVWAWLATGRRPVVERIADLPMSQRAPLMRIAVGEPATGLRGFRDSHREALRAQAVVVDAALARGVTFYRDVEVVSCLSADAEAMRALVARELGGLAQPGAAAARLRETVLAYLSVGGSSRAAAARLRLHKNTVLYRLKQAEELLGHPVDDRRLPLELALLLADTYGERVLR